MAHLLPMAVVVTVSSRITSVNLVLNLTLCGFRKTSFQKKHVDINLGVGMGSEQPNLTMAIAFEGDFAFYKRERQAPVAPSSRSRWR